MQLPLMCLLLALLPIIPAFDGLCCSKSSGSCHGACQQLTLAAIGADPEKREKKLKAVKNVCPSTLVNFWQCMNETLTNIEIGESWSGRQCCHVPHSSLCQKACIVASNKEELASNCRKSDELHFFSCLQRQQIGEECCGQAKTPECHYSCKAIFKSTLTPKKDQRDAVLANCHPSSPKVVLCVKNFTKVTPAPQATKYMHCCDKTSNTDCKSSCKTHLQSKAPLQEILDNLQEGGCGPPMPHDEFWQCFLHSDSVPKNSAGESRIDKIGLDSAKLHCCNRAANPLCRRLCVKTFSDEWMKSWPDFNRICLSSLTEDRLHTCIDEVEEPCELGCDGLNYCSNFNNRPTELFRSCTPAAEEAARRDVAMWLQEGYLSLPLGLKSQVPLRNISRCSPNMWKAVACALQIKPCHRDTHDNRICKEDCYEMLTECLDWSRMPTSETVALLCEKLAPEDRASPCISLKNYLEPSDVIYSPPHQLVTAHCKGEPCDSQELCTVNRNCEQGRPCQSYQCIPGCRMGEASLFVVPVGSYVRIPVPTENKGCVKICQCTENRLIEKCQPLPCVPVEDCWWGDQKFAHGSTFYSDCNICSCYAGEVTCSKKQCKGSERSIGRGGWASLPCNCPPHYVPFCGRNGNTYPNACLAKCAGLRDGDFEFGECSSKDPCEGNPCGNGFKCIPERKVCLSLLEQPCRQFICTDPNESCSGKTRSPVCDITQQEHPNLCYLARSGKALAYRGPCRTSCRTSGPVCGIDGETYESECAAIAHHRAVDYPGPCLAVGYITDLAQPMCRPTIVCYPLPPEGCMAVTPPGACCPICAGALRLLFSRKQVDRALYALQGAPTDDLSVHGVLSALERQIQVTECAIRGYLTVEQDFFVAVVATRNSSALQREVCEREAEKLASLIQRGSPRFLTELGLSTLTAATVVHIMAQSCSCIVTTSLAILILPIINIYHISL